MTTHVPLTSVDDNISKPQNAAASSTETTKAATAIKKLGHRVRRIGTL